MTNQYNEVKLQLVSKTSALQDMESERASHEIAQSTLSRERDYLQTQLDSSDKKVQAMTDEMAELRTIKKMHHTLQEQMTSQETRYQGLLEAKDREIRLREEQLQDQHREALIQAEQWQITREDKIKTEYSTKITSMVG